MSDWDEYADGWNDNPDVITYAEHSFNSLLEVIDINHLNLLDFGCGTGNLAELMAPLADHVVATDVSEKMIAVLKAKNIINIDAYALDIIRADLKRLPAFSRKFDLITASSVMAFVEDYVSTLASLRSLLAPNGILVQWDWLKTDEKEGFGFSPEMIMAAYQSAGYQPPTVTQPFSITSEMGTMKVIMAVARP